MYCSNWYIIIFQNLIISLLGEQQIYVDENTKHTSNKGGVRGNNKEEKHNAHLNSIFSKFIMELIILKIYRGAYWQKKERKPIKQKKQRI